MTGRQTISIAPLRGITNVTFRDIYGRMFHGVDYALAPFVSATSGKKVNLSVLKDILPEYNRNMRVIPQVIGSNPNDVNMMFHIINQEFGYDTININMGCPHKPIVSKGRGSGFLKNPDSIWRMLDKLFDDSNFHITVKTRLGYDDPEEIIGLIHKFNNYPIKELIIHTRTARQMYKGETNPEFFVKCMEISKIPLVYNGDIFSVEDYNMLKKLIPDCTSWMIGRGVVSNPFLPQEIKGKVFSQADKTRAIYKLHNSLYEEYSKILFGPTHLLGKMKEYWLYMSENLPDGRKLLNNIRRAKTSEHYEEIVNNFFQN
jgi:tRNA-dihydrouridine synthase B